MERRTYLPTERSCGQNHGYLSPLIIDKNDAFSHQQAVFCVGGKPL